MSSPQRKRPRTDLPALSTRRLKRHRPASLLKPQLTAARPATRSPLSSSSSSSWSSSSLSPSPTFATTLSTPQATSPEVPYHEVTALPGIRYLDKYLNAKLGTDVNCDQNLLQLMKPTTAPRSVSDTVIGFAAGVVVKAWVQNTKLGINKCLQGEQFIYRVLITYLTRANITPHLLTPLAIGACGKLPPRGLPVTDLLQQQIAARHYDSPIPLRYIVTPMVKLTLGDIVKSEALQMEVDMPVLVFQVIYTIMALAKMGIRHNDLHTDNIRVQLLNRPVTVRYCIGSQSITLRTRAMAYIFDFDRSGVNDTTADIILEAQPAFADDLDHICARSYDEIMYENHVNSDVDGGTSDLVRFCAFLLPNYPSSLAIDMTNVMVKRIGRATMNKHVTFKNRSLYIGPLTETWFAKTIGLIADAQKKRLLPIDFLNDKAFLAQVGPYSTTEAPQVTASLDRIDLDDFKKHVASFDAHNSNFSKRGFLPNRSAPRVYDRYQ